MELRQKLKVLDKLLGELRSGWVFVEGKRDKEALAELGCRNVLTISGNLRLSCERLASQSVGKVFVLTDLDRRGEQLARAAEAELEGHSMAADLMMRKRLARILKIRQFEDAKRGHDRIREEVEKES